MGLVKDNMGVEAVLHDPSKWEERGSGWYDTSQYLRTDGVEVFMGCISKSWRIDHIRIPGHPAYYDAREFGTAEAAMQAADFSYPLEDNDVGKVIGDVRPAKPGLFDPPAKDDTPLVATKEQQREWRERQPLDTESPESEAPSLLAAYTDDNPKTMYGDRKPPIHLIPPVALVAEAGVFKLGARKYGPYNWREKTVSSSVYQGAALRHLLAWWDGEDIDPESGESHLAHARACLGILLDAAANGKLNDDRPLPGKAADALRGASRLEPQA